MRKRIKQFELRKRRHEASKLRLQGWTLDEIARKLDIHFSQVSRDLKFVDEEWQQRAIQDRGEILEEQVAHYDLLIREYHAAWERSKLKGTGNPSYLAGVERCLERRSKLLGIDGSQASILETLRGVANLVKFMDQTVIAAPATAEQPPQQDPQGNGNGKMIGEG